MASKRSPDSRPRDGRVVETRGRKVLVRDPDGERDCFLAGQRAVIGDRVRWVVARGSGGKLVGVDPRATVLRRMDHRGRVQVLAANLEGLLVTVSVLEPGFRAGLLHRYLVAAYRDGLDAILVLSKVDLGVPDTVREHLARLEGLDVIEVSAHRGDGLDALRRRLASTTGAWALVGSSGVGKTSLIAALLPDLDVGAIGEISDYWGVGRHTTTHSRVFALPSGGEIADSPGIRNFTPVIEDPVDVRLHFPRVRDVQCRYRDCRHRPGEEGCIAEDAVPTALLQSYRTLLAEITEVSEANRP